MTDKKELIQKIDRAGAVNAEIKALEVEKEQLYTDIKDVLKEGESFAGMKFNSKKGEPARKQLDIKAIHKRLGTKKFVSIASVSIAALGKLMGVDEIDEMTKDYTIIPTLTIKPLKRK